MRSLRSLAIATLLSLALALALAGGPALAGAGNAIGEPPRPPPGGYRIWFDGWTWHVRGVSGDRNRRFHGILTVPGTAANVKTLPDRHPVKVVQRGTALRFEFVTAAEAGLDFTAEAQCIVLELMVDDRHLPELVRIGQNGVAPPLFPYEACK